MRIQNTGAQESHRLFDSGRRRRRIHEAANVKRDIVDLEAGTARIWGDPVPGNEEQRISHCFDQPGHA